jgi:hypothetical protein
LRKLEKALNPEILRGINSDANTSNSAGNQMGRQALIDLPPRADTAEGVNFDQIWILIFSPRRRRRFLCSCVLG